MTAAEQIKSAFAEMLATARAINADAGKTVFNPAAFHCGRRAFALADKYGQLEAAAIRVCELAGKPSAVLGMASVLKALGAEDDGESLEILMPGDLALLERLEGFLVGFEDDETQDQGPGGPNALLRELRARILGLQGTSTGDSPYGSITREEYLNQNEIHGDEYYPLPPADLFARQHRNFIAGFMDSTGIMDFPRAREQWEGYAHQIPEANRRNVESHGYGQGVKEGAEFLDYWHLRTVQLSPCPCCKGPAEPVPLATGHPHSIRCVNIGACPENMFTVGDDATQAVQAWEALAR